MVEFLENPGKKYFGWFPGLAARGWDCYKRKPDPPNVKTYFYIEHLTLLKYAPTPYHFMVGVGPSH